MHTSEQIREALDVFIRAHGKPTRLTASSVWSFGVVFADGFTTRMAMPRATITDPAALHEWVRDQARAFGASCKTSF